MSIDPSSFNAHSALNVVCRRRPIGSSSSVVLSGVDRAVRTLLSLACDVTRQNEKALFFWTNPQFVGSRMLR